MTATRLGFLLDATDRRLQEGYAGAARDALLNAEAAGPDEHAHYWVGVANVFATLAVAEQLYLGLDNISQRVER